MEREEIERHISCIIADFIPFTYNGIDFCIRSPDKEAHVIADQLFFEYYYRALENGVLDSDGVFKLLIRYGIWNEFKETNLNKLIKDVEDIKVQIFENYLDDGKRMKIKQVLKDTKNGIEVLCREKQTFDHLGAEFVANYAKYQFLTGKSIYRGKKPLWKSRKRWELPDEMCHEVNKALSRYKLDGEDYREIAVSESWRSIYNIRRGNLFGKPIVDYSDAQKYLVTWSQTYDNVYKSPDCPPDAIIDDFDALDGWFIVQRRKRDAELNKTTIESGMNEKIRNSEHIFVLTDENNIDKVYKMNDVGGKVALHKRLSQIKRAGVVNEANMLDTRLHLQEKAFELKRGV